MNARRTTDGKGERFEEEEKNRYGLRMKKMRNDDEEEKKRRCGVAPPLYDFENCKWRKKNKFEISFLRVNHLDQPIIQACGMFTSITLGLPVTSFSLEHLAEHHAAKHAGAGRHHHVPTTTAATTHRPLCAGAAVRYALRRISRVVNEHNNWDCGWQILTMPSNGMRQPRRESYS